MVDEPTRHTPPEEAATADRPASPHEVEWRDELSRLLSTLDDELVAAVSTARQLASAAVESVQARGSEMLAQLHQQRAEQDAQQAALQQRVADVQSSIEAVEEEVRLSQEDAERETAEILAAAQQRAEAIVADAEARAAEIIAAAHARGAGAATSTVESRNVEGRLRGLSDRVGRLLSTPGGAAAATAGVVGLGAAGAAAATATAGAAEDDEAPAAVADDVDGDEDEAEEFEAADEAIAADGAVAAADDVPPVMTPVVDASAADVEDEHAETDSVPGMPVWPTAEADEDRDEGGDLDERPTAIISVSDDEPVFMRRAPGMVADDDDDEQEQEAGEGAGAADEPVMAESESEPEPVAAGPAGAVTQTLIFQSVPNFQAALALERSLKAMSEVREVRVADFDERQLTFQVTHELGSQLARVLLTQRGGELELVEARSERVEFVFRS